MPSSPSPRPRILVVEDEAPVCEMLTELLTQEGYDPQCVLGDRDAYAVLDREGRAFAALVVDINLGVGTTGLDVARYARRLNQQLPVLYITGGSTRSVERLGVPGGVLVTKPFDSELLLQTLRDRLGAAA